MKLLSWVNTRVIRQIKINLVSIHLDKRKTPILGKYYGNISYHNKNMYTHLEWIVFIHQNLPSPPAEVGAL